MIADAIAAANRAHQQGDLSRAAYLYKRALAELHNQLGIVLGQQGNLEEAARSLEQAVEFWPDLAPAFSNLGNVLRLKGDLEGAAERYREALRLQPEFADGYNNLGATLVRLGSVEDAVTAFETALQLNPHAANARSNLLLSLNYLPGIQPERVFQEHCRWATEPRPMAIGDHDRNPDRRLRIGYVSGDFCEHVVAHFLMPLLENHDRDRFEVHCYSQVAAPDSMTLRFQSLAAVWRTIFGRDTDAAAQRIYDDNIDILIDLSGHTAENRLDIFSRKPCPIQMTYLGYPNTTGLVGIDYRITDSVLDPPGNEAYYTENLLTLEPSFCCYDPIKTAPTPGPLPASKHGWITFGSTNDLAKINDDVLDLWADVLVALPDTRLVIVRSTMSEKRKSSLHQELVARGIEPSRYRLENTLPRPNYLEVYNEMDILLDVFPWTGHVTTCEALWMGVPVLTLLGKRASSRLSASVLTCLGLGDWIARNTEEYVAAAVRNTQDRDLLGELRATLRDRMGSSQLCDGQAFTRRIEDVYRLAWRRWCSGSGSVGA